MKPTDKRAMVLAMGLLVLLHPIPFRLFGDEPKSVMTVSPMKGDLRTQVITPGRIEPAASVQIRSRIPGFIQQIMVDLGHKVEAGQVLAIVDCPELHTDLKRKGVALEIAKVEIVEAERGLVILEAVQHKFRALIEESRAELEKTRTELALREKEVERLKELVETKVAPESRLIEVQNALRLAKQSLQVLELVGERRKHEFREAEANREQAAVRMEILRRRVQLAEIDVNRANVLLDYATIKAPFAGVVTHRNVTPGQLVSPQNPEGDALFTLASLNRVRVVAAIPVHSMPRVGSAVRVGIGGKSQDCQVSRMAPVVDPETQTIRIEIDMPNEDGQWLAGAAVNVQVPVTRSQVWTVPRAVVLQRDKDTFCYLVEDGLARLCRIKIGSVEADRVEILGMQVVGSKEVVDLNRMERAELILEPSTVSDGQRVKPRP